MSQRSPGSAGCRPWVGEPPATTKRVTRQLAAARPRVLPGNSRQLRAGSPCSPDLLAKAALCRGLSPLRGVRSEELRGFRHAHKTGDDALEADRGPDTALEFFVVR